MSVDLVNGDRSCRTPRDTQLQVVLAAGETKKILVFVHANQPIANKHVVNRVYIEACDDAGEIVDMTHNADAF